MARTFTGSEYLSRNFTPVTAAPWTLAARFRADGNGASFQHIASITRMLVNPDQDNIQLQVLGGTGQITGYASDSSANFFGCLGPTGIAVNVWHSVVFVAISATSRFLVFDGSKVASDTSNVVNGGHGDNFGIGAAAGAFNFFHGAVAEVAFWNVALTPWEAFVYCSGIPAPSIRLGTGSLIGYWPVGVGSPDKDFSQYKRDLTLTNAPVVTAGPPQRLIFSKPRFFSQPAAGGGAAAAISRAREFAGFGEGGRGWSGF